MYLRTHPSNVTLLNKATLNTLEILTLLRGLWRALVWLTCSHQHSGLGGAELLCRPGHVGQPGTHQPLETHREERHILRVQQQQCPSNKTQRHIRDSPQRQQAGGTQHDKQLRWIQDAFGSNLYVVNCRKQSDAFKNQTSVRVCVFVLQMILLPPMNLYVLHTCQELLVWRMPEN